MLKPLDTFTDCREAAAQLEGANLAAAHLEGANLEEANLMYANLRGAHLEGANLEEANLEEANLEEANLEEANLEEANLEEANLAGASLESPDFAGRVMWWGGTKPTQEQVNKAWGDEKTRLPARLTRPAHWSKATTSDKPNNSE